MNEIKRGLAPVREATTLQAFLLASGYDVNPDGTFGPGTEAALVKFQREHGLIADGVAGEKTWTTLFSLHPDLLAKMSALWLSQQDIDDFAARLDLEVPLVRTVYGVESGGSGFVGTKAKILFEGHVFWSELEAAGIDPRSRVAGNEDILFPKWNPKSYVGGLAEYARLERAIAIAEAPALRSASWGLFQILGLHAESLGFTNVRAFVDAMQSREAAHLAENFDLAEAGGQRQRLPPAHGLGDVRKEILDGLGPHGGEHRAHVGVTVRDVAGDAAPHVRPRR